MTPEKPETKRVCTCDCEACEKETSLNDRIKQVEYVLNRLSATVDRFCSDTTIITKNMLKAQATQSKELIETRKRVNKLENRTQKQTRVLQQHLGNKNSSASDLDTQKQLALIQNALAQVKSQIDQLSGKK